MYNVDENYVLAENGFVQNTLRLFLSEHQE